MDIDKLIEFLLQYQGKNLKLTEMKQWCKNGNCNSISLNNKTELKIHKHSYNDKEIFMWVEYK
jgi:hypothetical protein